jgi:hypothetical protein
MRNNSEKWNEYKGRLDAIDSEFIKNQLGHYLPTHIYSVSPNGSIETRVIIKAEYRHLHAIWYSGKKPTAKDVAKIAAYIESGPPMIKDEIFFYWLSERDKARLSGGTRYEELTTCPYLTTSKDKAEKIAEENRIKDKEKERLLASGWIACAYCGKVVAPEVAVECTVIASQYPGMRKTSKYCSGKCGGNDQMAHEG